MKTSPFVESVTTLHPEVIVVDAERAFLGAAMAGAPDAVVELATLVPDDFTTARHKAVFQALLSLHDRGVPPEAPLVLHELRNLGAVERWGDAPGVGPFLYDLLGWACPGPSAPYYAAALKEATARRRVQVLASRLGQAAQSNPVGHVRQLLADELAAAVLALNRVE